MNWEQFMFHARADGLLLWGGGSGEITHGDLLLIPLITPKDPRNVYELVKLVGIHAHPAKHNIVAKQLLERLTKRADTTNPEVRTITWHCRWRLPDGVHPDECITLGEYLTTNGYATT